MLVYHSIYNSFHILLKLQINVGHDSLRPGFCLTAVVVNLRHKLIYIRSTNLSLVKIDSPDWAVSFKTRRLLVRTSALGYAIPTQAFCDILHLLGANDTLKPSGYYVYHMYTMCLSLNK